MGDSGITAALKLHQEITPNVSLALAGSSQAAYDEYSAGLWWRMSAGGSRPLILGVIASHVNGKLGVPDDDRLLFSVGFDLGGKPPSQAQQSLLSWSAEPAVYIPEVLAIADQAVADTIVAAVDKTGLPNGSTVDETTGDVIVNNLQPLTGNPINSVSRNGVNIGVDTSQFRVSGGAIVIQTRNLTAPATYVVSLNEADGDRTEVTVTTAPGSVRLAGVSIASNILQLNGYWVGTVTSNVLNVTYDMFVTFTHSGATLVGDMSIPQSASVPTGTLNGQVTSGSVVFGTASATAGSATFQATTTSKVMTGSWDSSSDSGTFTLRKQ